MRDDAQRAFADSLASQGIVRWTIDQQRPAVVRDTAADPRTLPDAGHAQPRSVIIAPLRAHTGDVSGVVAYTHCEPNAFNDDQIPLVESISAQVSVALNNARLYQQLEQQRFGASALAQATQAMSRSLSDEELYHALADQLASIFKAECVIHLWNEGEGTLTPTSLVAQPGNRAAWPTLNQPFPTDERPDLLNVVESRSLRIATQSARGKPGGEPRESMRLPLICAPRSTPSSVSRA
ncbi:MAG: GAF domain-containing protein [Chloroflexi bacterium]|nr:GAF domain-containing protein [Chloroflexota bacterium]